MVSIYDKLLAGIGASIMVGILATQVSIALGLVPFVVAAVLVAVALFAVAPTDTPSASEASQQSAQSVVAD